jgi:predicted transcriptional regulator
MTVFINRNLKELRREMGVSQDAFATMLGISRPALGSYEEGRAQAPLPIVARAMELCDVPQEDMYKFIFDPEYLS